MNEKTILTRSEVPWRNIDGNVIVVDPTAGHIYPFNSVGTRIWLLLDGSRPVSEVVKTILSEFEGEAEVIRKDALLFIEELLKASLIKDE